MEAVLICAERAKISRAQILDQSEVVTDGD